MRYRSVWPGIGLGIVLFLLAGCGGGRDVGAPTTTATTPALGLKADYQFQNTLKSTTGTAPDLVNIGSSGANTFTTATVDGQSRTVLTFPENNGLALPSTTGVISNDTYSIVVLFSFTDATSGYRRVLDFKNGSQDTGLYFLHGNMNFYDVASATTTSITSNTFVQVVLTRDAARNVVGYVNGVQQISFTDTGDLGVIDLNNILRFFQDNGSEASAGSVARIRIYDSVLSPTDVSGLDRLP